MQPHELKGRTIREVLEQEIDSMGGRWHVDTSRPNGIIHVCNQYQAFIGYLEGGVLYLERETIEGWERLEISRRLALFS